MHVHMIFTDYTFENPYVFGVADLHEKVSAADFDVACQDVVAILRAPDQMCRQSCNCVPTVPVVSHRARLLSCDRSV